MRKAVPAGRQGSGLLTIIFVFAILSVLAALFAKIVYNAYASTNAVLVREQAFYLAEAGLEKGKVALTNNANWYTDLPHSPADNTEWLINSAVGQKTEIGEGFFKVVKEQGKNRLYSIGFKGKGVVLLKLTFSPAPSFESLAWEEL